MATKNAGKIFEEDFKKSVPGNRDVMRIQDGGSFGAGTSSRFFSGNIADYIIYTGDTLFYIECKSVKDGRIHLQNINKKHLESMIKKQEEKRNVVCLFAVQYRDTGSVFLIPAEVIWNYIEILHKQPAEHDIAPKFKIPVRKKIVRYAFDLSVLGTDLYTKKSDDGQKVQELQSDNNTPVPGPVLQQQLL